MSVLRSSLTGRRRATLKAAVVAAVAMILPMSALPAQAAPLRAGGYFERPAPYDDSFEFDPECPGLDLTVQQRSRGVASLRHVIGSGRQAFFLKDRNRFKETWTDDTTGRVLFTIKGRNVVKEVDARRVATSAVPDRFVPDGGIVGPVFEFTVYNTGADVLRDASGRLLAYQGGRLVFKNLFDTQGDHRPGGESLRFRPTKVIGPHPLLSTDICDLASEQAAAQP